MALVTTRIDREEWQLWNGCNWGEARISATKYALTLRCHFEHRIVTGSIKSRLSVSFCAPRRAYDEG